ncbi:MAG: PIN domain-containing protein [Bacteroidia bacterium]
MIYLTFDSNIWIYSLDESWQIENQLDYLEPWIQRGEVKLLLPKMIIEEWNKHEEKQVGVREKKLREFFSMAEDILPSAFFSEYKEPAAQKKIIDDQLKRAKKLILESECITEYSEVKDRIVNDGIAKKAPLHKKSSIADAIIVYSLIHYAKLNQGNHYFFISNNTDDFYQKVSGKWEIHLDLKVDFESNNIQSFTTLTELIYFLQKAHGLKLDENINQKRKERLRNKLKEKVYNPEYDKLIDSGESSYIQNINTIDFILKEAKPTKEQVIFVLALVDSDASYERNFYKRLDKASWFNILKRKGAFITENSPASIYEKEVLHIPFWEPLAYLEKLSNQIKAGTEIELADEIIFIIKSVSENPKENFRTWYFLIKILNNLPNEVISKEILEFIPVWLTGSFDTMMESSELCESLLPKFLSDDATQDDIEKAEVILRHLFAIEKARIVVEGFSGMESESYHSRVSLYYLADTLIDKKLASRIVAHCSSDIIIYLANNLKKLLFDFPKGINISIVANCKEIIINCYIQNEEVFVSVTEKGSVDLVIGKSQIPNFENYNEIESKKKIIRILKELKIEYTPTEDNEHNLSMLTNALINGSNYSLSANAISKLNDRNYNQERVVDVFALVFRDLLNEKIKQNANDGIVLLRLFLSDNFYRLSFFSRVVFYVIGENWKITKSLFWEQVKDDDSKHILSNYKFDKDLYEVLNKNQMFLNDAETKLLQSIIGKGPQGEIDDRELKYSDYWKLRWYSALRDVEPFKSKYNQASQSQNLTNEHYENVGGSSSVSPFSFAEILQKNNEEIVKYIHNFKPKDRWEEPTIEGLSGALSKAVENEPDKFSEEIELYKDVYYIYTYHILNGFREAWKNKRSFNWKKVLNFAKDYITSDKFYSGQLSLQNDGRGATPDWIFGSVGNLLTQGMQSDSNAFDLELLPTAKEIIKIIVANLKQVEDFKRTNMDYPTYALNSTAGKILRTLLDYSVRRGRSLKSDDNSPKWEADIIALLESTFKKGIIDGYILTGWYFQQFYFLDKEWLTNQVKDNYELEDKYWLAFMGGFAFSNPPFNRDIYQLFYPHYERVIKNHVEIKSLYEKGLIGHIVTFYFWGFEDFKSEGLLLLLINKGKPSLIVEIVNFVSLQEAYVKSLSAVESGKFEEIIFNFWNYLATKYESTRNEEEQKILARLSNLIVFVPELNEKYTGLILKSNGLSDKYFHSHYLLEKLIKLMAKGEQTEVAKYIGQILCSIPFKGYSSTIDNKYIIDLVIFLYENGQKNTAVKFCNKMTKQGHVFLIPIHNKYK